MSAPASPDVCLHSPFSPFRMAYYIEEISGAISSNSRVQFSEQIDQTLTDLNSFERDPLIISTVKVLCTSAKLFAQEDSASRASTLRALCSRIENWSDLCTTHTPPGIYSILEQMKEEVDDIEILSLRHKNVLYSILSTTSKMVYDFLSKLLSVED